MLKTTQKFHGIICKIILQLEGMKFDSPSDDITLWKCFPQQDQLMGAREKKSDLGREFLTLMSVCHTVVPEKVLTLFII